ncbi:protease complex subunit PrcB family protein [Methyloprofundus sp.]|uniref:protease complex subunit PrcB family protein n=1 Tax=Methyloprofundus sp. TaxID=2020875 RepID=UPI003D09899B
MKFLFWKYYVSVMLMAIISVAHADEMFSDEAFSYIVIKKLVYSPPNQTPWGAVINTQEEWGQLFGSWQGDFAPQEPAPRFYFEQYQLVTGGFGAKPSGGYSVVVDRVDELGDAIYVSVLDISPGSGCSVSWGFTSPYATILIKKSTKPIKFSITKLVTECAS